MHHRHFLDVAFAFAGVIRETRLVLSYGLAIDIRSLLNTSGVDLLLLHAVNGVPLKILFVQIHAQPLHHDRCPKQQSNSCGTFIQLDPGAHMRNSHPSGTLNLVAVLLLPCTESCTTKTKILEVGTDATQSVVLSAANSLFDIVYMPDIWRTATQKKQVAVIGLEKTGDCCSIASYYSISVLSATPIAQFLPFTAIEYVLNPRRHSRPPSFLTCSPHSGLAFIRKDISHLVV